MDAPVGLIAGGEGRAVSCFAPHGGVSIATGGVGGNRDLAFSLRWRGRARNGKRFNTESTELGAQSSQGGVFALGAIFVVTDRRNGRRAR
jgi:hypothetical protein